MSYDIRYFPPTSPSFNLCLNIDVVTTDSKICVYSSISHINCVWSHAHLLTCLHMLVLLTMWGTALDYTGGTRAHRRLKQHSIQILHRPRQDRTFPSKNIVVAGVFFFNTTLIDLTLVLTCPDLRQPPTHCQQKNSSCTEGDCVKCVWPPCQGVVLRTQFNDDTAIKGLRQRLYRDFNRRQTTQKARRSVPKEQKSNSRAFLFFFFTIVASSKDRMSSPLTYCLR